MLELNTGKLNYYIFVVMQLCRNTSIIVIGKITAETKINIFENWDTFFLTLLVRVKMVFLVKN